LNIKKRFKKEKTNKKRALFICIIVMILMPYMVIALNEQSIFGGWEYYFALAYAILVDLLLIFYLVRKFNDSKISFQIIGRKIKIRDSFFKFYYSISFEKIIYIDIIDKKNLDFDIVIVMKKGKKNKRFINFNIGYIKTHQQYKGIYEHLNNRNEVVDYQCILINRGGTKKFYLLYLIYKNSYNADLSPRVLDYVKKFMEEYNMS
jgi:hypothetical protein